MVLNEDLSCSFKGKGPLSALYILKYPVLENKYYGADLNKIHLEIRKMYFIFYITVSMGAAILNIKLDIYI